MIISLDTDNEELIKAENLCTELFESIVNIVGPEKGEEIHRDMYKSILDDIYDNPGIEILKRLKCGSESYVAAERMLESFLEGLCEYTGFYSGVHNQDSIKSLNESIRDNMETLSNMNISSDMDSYSNFNMKGTEHKEKMEDIMDYASENGNYENVSTEDLLVALEELEDI